MNTQQKERRRYPRAPLHLPVLVSIASPQSAFTAQMLNASPAGLLLKLPEGLDMDTNQQVTLRIALGEGHTFDIGAGTIRRKSTHQGCQTLGIELLEKTPLLCGPSMIGVSPCMLKVKSLLSQVCKPGINILIRGETGTGKNVLAKLIHDMNRGEQAPFIRVNCPSIPESLFESELFGHEKGAFTDAKSSAPGYFRLAGDGTILLDEISEINLHLQAKLLSVLEDKQFVPVGGAKLVPVRAHIIATSNIDLEQAVEVGHFRRDLFYRLCEMPIHLPPLRDRKEDLILLAHYFLETYSLQFGRTFKALSAEDAAALTNYDWPGNVRELENYMKQSALLGKFIGPVAGLSPPAAELPSILEELGLPTDLYAGQNTLPELMHQLTSQIEQTLITKTLQSCSHNKTRAAERLGISYRTLLRKLDQYKSTSHHQNHT